MADQGRVVRRIGGGIRAAYGAEHGKEKKYEELAERDERQRYRQAHGAGGLGGARRASSEDFKAKEDAHIRAWRTKRAKKRGQQRAATEVKPKD